MFRKRSYNRKFLVQWNQRMCHSNVDPLYDDVCISILKQQGVDVEYVPRNLYQPDALYEAIERYQPEFAPSVDFHDPDVVAGRNLAFRCFAKPPEMGYLKPIRLDHNPRKLFQLLNVNGKSSAGLTAYGMNKAEAFSIAMRKVPEILNGKNPDPCLAGARTQAGKTGRLVWMYPYAMTLLEGCVARPIINYFLGTNSTTMAFGQRSSTMGIGIRKAQSHNDYYVALDASKFDTTVATGVIRSGFSALRTWFNPNDEVGYGCTVSQVFDIVEDYFIHTPIVMPSEDGPTLMTGKVHGVPSGSYFTQIIDSFANTMMAGALSRHFHLNLRVDEIWVLGDDMLFFSRKSPNLDKYASFLVRTFGMNVNADKSCSGPSAEGVHFLGRTWSNGLPYWKFNEVVQRAVAPESYRKYVDKDKEARLVFWSFRNTGFIRGAPKDFYLTLPIIPGGRHVFRSGLAEFYAREGLLLGANDTLF